MLGFKPIRRHLSQPMAMAHLREPTTMRRSATTLAGENDAFSRGRYQYLPVPPTMTTIMPSARLIATIMRI
jgi:hypothetical protein